MRIVNDETSIWLEDHLYRILKSMSDDPNFIKGNELVERNEGAYLNTLHGYRFLDIDNPDNSFDPINWSFKINDLGKRFINESRYRYYQG